MVTTVEVKFATYDKSYHYLCDIPFVKRGDYAVVHTGEQFKVVEIHAVHDRALEKATKHVITVFDMSDYKQKEATRAKLLAARKQLREKVLARVEEFTTAQMAAIDPEIAALVEQIEKLKN